MKQRIKLLFGRKKFFSAVFMELFEEKRVYENLSLTSQDLVWLFFSRGIKLSDKSIISLCKKVTSLDMDELLILYRKQSLS
jgi:hypothetical protein